MIEMPGLKRSPFLLWCLILVVATQGCSSRVETISLDTLRGQWKGVLIHNEKSILDVLKKHDLDNDCVVSNDLVWRELWDAIGWEAPSIDFGANRVLCVVGVVNDRGAIPSTIHKIYDDGTSWRVLVIVASGGTYPDLCIGEMYHFVVVGRTDRKISFERELVQLRGWGKPREFGR